VPVFDVLLVLLPAEKDFAATQKGGKVNQTAVEVLELNLAFWKFRRSF
jgi:hypothetical protein